MIELKKIIIFGRMKKITAILFALLILFSSMGFSMNTHVCKGEAVKTSMSVGFHKLSCEMPMMATNIETPDTGKRIHSKPCCKNIHFDLKLKDEFQTESSLDHISPVFLLAFTHVFVEPIFFVSSKKEVADYTLYIPPIPDKNIQVLFQTFLI